MYTDILTVPFWRVSAATRAPEMKGTEGRVKGDTEKRNDERGEGKYGSFCT